MTDKYLNKELFIPFYAIPFNNRNRYCSFGVAKLNISLVANESDFFNTNTLNSHICVLRFQQKYNHLTFLTHLKKYITTQSLQHHSTYLFFVTLIYSAIQRLFDTFNAFLFHHYFIASLHTIQFPHLLSNCPTQTAAHCSHCIKIAANVNSYFH